MAPSEPEQPATGSTKTSKGRGRKSKSTDADDEEELLGEVVASSTAVTPERDAAPARKRGRPKKSVTKDEVEEGEPVSYQVLVDHALHAGTS